MYCFLHPKRSPKLFRPSRSYISFSSSAVHGWAAGSYAPTLPFRTWTLYEYSMLPTTTRHVWALKTLSVLEKRYSQMAGHSSVWMLSPMPSGYSCPWMRLYAAISCLTGTAAGEWTQSPGLLPGPEGPQTG